MIFDIEFLKLIKNNLKLMLKTLYDTDCTTFSPQGKLF